MQVFQNRKKKGKTSKKDSSMPCMVHYDVSLGKRLQKSRPQICNLKHIIQPQYMESKSKDRSNPNLPPPENRHFQKKMSGADVQQQFFYSLFFRNCRLRISPSQLQNIHLRIFLPAPLVLEASGPPWFDWPVSGLIRPCGYLRCLNAREGELVWLDLGYLQEGLLSTVGILIFPATRNENKFTATYRYTGACL